MSKVKKKHVWEMSKEEIDMAYKELQNKKKEKAKIEVEEELKKIEEERLCSDSELDFLKILAIIDSMPKNNEKLWYTDVVTQCFNFNCKFSFGDLMEDRLGRICKKYNIKKARYQNRSYIVKDSIMEIIQAIKINTPKFFINIEKNLFKQQKQQDQNTIICKIAERYMRQIEKEKK